MKQDGTQTTVVIVGTEYLAGLLKRWAAEEERSVSSLARRLIYAEEKRRAVGQYTANRRNVDTTKAKSIVISITPDLHDLIRQWAAEEERSVSYIVRKMVLAEEERRRTGGDDDDTV